ncbi:MAG: hypothetical protein HOK97_11810 [Deltaproteobacteria bacterium]|jgi:hypothetical protein|nr:hypothetical protein [Deltaproteobacteria bacterium]
MKKTYPRGPIRLSRRSDIGNGLWWIARRQMSAWRLSRNHEAIQERIARAETGPSLRAFAATMGFTLLFGTLAWGTSWQIKQRAVGHQITIATPIIVPSAQSLTQFRAIKVLKAPVQVQPLLKEPPKLPSPKARPLRRNRTRPARASIGSDAHRQNPPSSPYPLSDLLRRFREAKAAHEAGHLDQAFQKFLNLARQQSHTSLGPESYLRAIAIQRELRNHQEAQKLFYEAKSHWPNLREITELNRNK